MLAMSMMITATAEMAAYNLRLLITVSLGSGGGGFWLFCNLWILQPANVAVRI
jgi:hypothetical protein